MNTYYEIDKIKTIILKDERSTKFSVGVNGVERFTIKFKKTGADEAWTKEYDVEVWAEGRCFASIASDFIGAFLFKEEGEAT